MKILATALAAASVSCFPGRFDDLEKETWVQFAERNNDQVAGDPAVDIAPMDLHDGRTKGGVFVMSHQGVGGITEVTFDETGGVAARVGAAGNVNVAGGIAPLNNNEVFTIAPFTVSGTITGYVAGQPRFSQTPGSNPPEFIGKVAKFGPNVTAGTVVGPPTGVQELGNDIIVGDFGSGAATPDIIILGALKLTVVNGAGVARSCGLHRPNFSPAYAQGFKNAALDKVLGNARNQLVVSGLAGDNTPTVYVMESTDIVDGAAFCGSTASFATGSKDNSDQPALTIAVGDLNGSGGLDMVIATIGNPDASPVAKIKYFPDINFASPGAGMELSPTSDDAADSLYGARMIIDDVDGDGKNELVYSDPTANLPGATGAGKVFIATFQSTCSTMRGPACIKEILTSTDPGTDNHYGRALATTKFISSKGTKKILGVGERNRLNVYFKVTASQTDPRDL